MAQIWIFFAAGVGGDGLANLLEQSDGVTVWGQDQSGSSWRVHRVVDDQVKFWAPPVDKKHCFRKGHWFEQQDNVLQPEYLQAVRSNATIVVTSHDIVLYNLDRSESLDVFGRDQIRVLVDSRDYLKCHQDAVKKNLMIVALDNFNDVAHAVATPSLSRYRQTDRSRFDRVVWIEDLSTETQLVAFARDLGLRLKSEIVQQYLLLRSPQWSQVLGPRWVPRFQSYIESGMICYKSLDSGPVDQ